MNSVCRRRSVSSKRAPKCSVNSVCSVREKPSQRVSQLFFFSQMNTEEQNTQHSTETLSQPISQNLTATFSSNALWTLYAGGVLWARNCAPKTSVNSVRSVREKITSVREKTLQQVTCVSSHRVGAFYFSQKNTEEQNLLAHFSSPWGGRGQLGKGVAQLLLVREVIPTKRLIKGEKTLINVCKYYQK